MSDAVDRLEELRRQSGEATADRVVEGDKPSAQQALTLFQQRQRMHEEERRRLEEGGADYDGQEFWRQQIRAAGRLQR